MPAFSDRPCDYPSNEDVKSTIESSCVELPHLKASSGGNFSNICADWPESTDLKVKTEAIEEASPEPSPRMTIDGTCAPPRLPYSRFLCTAVPQATLPSRPPNLQARAFHVRMSTGGRAPPKISSLKERISCVIQEPMPTTSPVMVRPTTVEGSSNQNILEMPVRGHSTTTEITKKGPQGHHKTLRSSCRNTQLNQSASITQCGAKPRGRPKKRLESKSEYLMKKFQGRPKMSSPSILRDFMKRLRGRPKKSNPSSSANPMKRPRGRPKKSIASTLVNPMKKPRGRPKKCSASMSEDFVKMSRGNPKKSSASRSKNPTERPWEIPGKSSAITSEVTRKRPVGRPKGSVNERRVLPQVKACLEPKICGEPFVLLSRWTQKG